MKDESLPEVVAEIRTLRADFPVLIAIEGYGGSGKSTFAAALSAALGRAYVVPIDDFIVKEKITDPSWEKGAFDRQRLEDQVLKPARNGEAISYQKLLW
jgi:adenylate kinase family enzyme